MGIWEWVILLAIAGICGFLGEAIAGSSRGGLLVAIALGFIGALIGMWLARAAHCAGIAGHRRRRPQFPGGLVHYRRGPVRRRHEPADPAAGARLILAGEEHGTTGRLPLGPCIS